jgi:phospholipase/carboxylesterase
MTNEFIYRFEPAKRAGVPPLLLLHGTGGDENDLLKLGETISPGSALLSPRGKVLERGMPRFFRRLTEGVFDEADVKRRANELADFVETARDRYGLDAPVALGYSNGANIAAAMMLLRPQVLAGGVLLRAMVPLAHPPKADLAHRPVLISSGSRRTGEDVVARIVDCDCGDRGRLWICRSEPFDAGLHPAGGHAAVGLAQRA